jgi:DNA polymerase-4
VLGRTVTLKVRYGSFVTITRATTLPRAVDTGAAVAAAAKALLAQVDLGEGVRLLGVTAGQLVGPEGGAEQLSFDDLTAAAGADGGAPEEPAADWNEATRAIDAVRDRFGAAAIGPARLVGPDGLQLARRGSQQWGPNGRSG